MSSMMTMQQFWEQISWHNCLWILTYWIQQSVGTVIVICHHFCFQKYVKRLMFEDPVNIFYQECHSIISCIHSCGNQFSKKNSVFKLNTILLNNSLCKWYCGHQNKQQAFGTAVHIQPAFLQLKGWYVDLSEAKCTLMMMALLMTLFCSWWSLVVYIFT